MILTILAIYFVVYFQHPDDKNQAYFPKFIVTFGFIQAFGTVLLLPLDISNSDGSMCSFTTDFCDVPFDMELFWTIMFWANLVMLTIVIPFTMFYYEADDFDFSAMSSGKPLQKIGCTGKAKGALCYEVFVLIVSAVIVFVPYLLSHTSKVPVTEMEGVSFDSLISNTGEVGTFDVSFPAISADELSLATSASDRSSEENVEVDLTLSQYLPAILIFIGYFFFSIFGGVGTAAIPLNLISSYINRPVKMDPVKLNQAKETFRERVNELIERGKEVEEIKNKDNSSLGFWEKRKLNKEADEKLKKFKRDCYALEDDYETLNFAKSPWRKFGAIYYPLKLIIGILCAIVAIVWILQVVIYTLPDDPFHPFLNEYLEYIDFFPVFPFVTISVFSFYLLFAVITGNLMLGLNVGFFTIHPMKYGATYMSSMLFNLGLVLLTTLPLVQFVISSLTLYGQYTILYQIVGTNIFYLDFFSFFFENHVFVIAYVVVTILTVFYFLCCKCGKGEGTSVAEKISRMGEK